MKRLQRILSPGHTHNLCENRLEVRQGEKGHCFQSDTLVYFYLHVLLAITLLMFISMCGVIIYACLLRYDLEVDKCNTTKNQIEVELTTEYANSSIMTFTKPSHLKLVTRRDWLAQSPSGEITPLQLPVPYVIIMHTATENCSEQGTCTSYVRFIQTFHIENRNWFDIGYNFLVGGDGYAYEGRGWKGQGAHTYGYNFKSIGIAFIGTFHTSMPPERQIIAAKQLITIGLENGYIAKDYKMLAARQVRNNQSPGLVLYEDLKKWSHWTTKP